jgi:exodeoxyribonuclease VII large subunit
VQSPVPLVSGVGHETDFTIADFAPTCARPRPRRLPSWWPSRAMPGWLRWTSWNPVQGGMDRWLDRQGQRLDLAAQRLGRPSGNLAQQRLRCERLGQRCGMRCCCRCSSTQVLGAQQANLMPMLQRQLLQRRQHLTQLATAWNCWTRAACCSAAMPADRQQGRAVTRVADAPVGAALKAHLSDGSVDVTVTQPRCCESVMWHSVGWRAHCRAKPAMPCIPATQNAHRVCANTATGPRFFLQCAVS